MKNFYEFLQIIESQNIHRQDQVRNKIASIETYWEKPGQALTHIQEILFDHGYLILVPTFSVHDKALNHTERFIVYKKTNPEDPNSETEETNSMLIFSWHWMPSGEQVEVNAYLS